MLLKGQPVADKIKADIIHAVEEYKKAGNSQNRPYCESEQGKTTSLMKREFLKLPDGRD